jgi:hypothetical protein
MACPAMAFTVPVPDGGTVRWHHKPGDAKRAGKSHAGTIREPADNWR